LILPFTLDPRLAASSKPLCDLHLCEARLQLDVRFPWIILIPRREGARELEDLDPEELVALTAEILKTAQAVRAAGSAAGNAVEKLNIGALGNIVSQLHIHIVGRRVGDAAWPGPVWGAGEAVPYDEVLLEMTVAAACEVFSGGTA
jgi:diadenosine tetraphosphate (Ap4A) HIT family hydrolase